MIFVKNEATSSFFFFFFSVRSHMHFFSLSPFTHTSLNFDQLHSLFLHHHSPPSPLSFPSHLILFRFLSPSSAVDVLWSLRVVTLIMWVKVILIFLYNFITRDGCYNFPKIVRCNDHINMWEGQDHRKWIVLRWLLRVITLSIYVTVSVIGVEFLISFLTTF